jgi:hypothetical protein
VYFFAKRMAKKIVGESAEAVSQENRTEA